MLATTQAQRVEAGGDDKENVAPRADSNAIANGVRRQ